MWKARLAALLLLLSGLAVVAEAPAQAYTCTVDSASTVGVDWLKVHTQPSTTSAAVGQVPRNSWFHYCSSSGRTIGSYWWVYGYGYNGSTKLTGWVVGSTPYLAHP